MSYAEACVEIHAPIEVVWNVMLDVKRYPEWNPFVVRIDLDGPPRSGSDLTLHVRWANGRGTTTTERITKADPYELEYEFRGPIHTLGMVRGRRMQRLERIDEARTRYITYESLHGWAAWAAPIARVQDGFERHAAALKGRAEQV